MRVFIYEGTAEEILKLFGGPINPDTINVVRMSGGASRIQGADNFVERFGKTFRNPGKDTAPIAQVNSGRVRPGITNRSSEKPGKTASSKGRPRPRISESTRKDVIELAEVNTSVAEIAELTGVSTSSIHRIIKNAVDGCGSPLKYKFRNRPLTKEKIAQIKQLHSEGLTRRVIADRAEVSLGTISKVINYK